MKTRTRALALAAGLLVAGGLVVSLITPPSEGPNPVPYERDLVLDSEQGWIAPLHQPERRLGLSKLDLDFAWERGFWLESPGSYVIAGVPLESANTFRARVALDPAATTTGLGSAATLSLVCQRPGDRPRTARVELARVQLDAEQWTDLQAPLHLCRGESARLGLEARCQDHCQQQRIFLGQPILRTRAELRSSVRELVLVISIDTLRPDRLAIYGAKRPTGGAIRRLAQDATVFDLAFSPAPWTIPAHASLLTSLSPQQHRATAQVRLAPELTTLAEVFRDAGWATAGFVDVPYLRRTFGFEQGFADYDDELSPKGDYRRGAGVTSQRVLDWLGSTDARRAFVFWHVMDVHGPYGAPHPQGGTYRRQVPTSSGTELRGLARLAYHDYLGLERFSSLEDLKAAYDEGIDAADAHVGKVLDLLRRIGLYEDATIVLTSDHGESFLDHGAWVGHGLFLTDDEVRVPLIIKPPGGAQMPRSAELASLLDVFPTVLTLAGLPIPEQAVGHPLSLSADGPRPAERPVFGASSNTGAEYIRSSAFKHISPPRIDARQVISDHLRPKDSLPNSTILPLLQAQAYDLRLDPTENRSLDPDNGITACLNGALATHRIQPRDAGELARECLSQLHEATPDGR